jgi:hypothetical protein
MGENAGVEQPQGQPVNNGGTGQQPQNQGPENRPPYADYLDKIPEGLRGVVEPTFKEWDANVTRRFQDLNGQNTEYEPYQAYFDEYEPEAIGQAIQLAQMLNSPEGAQQVYQQLHQMFGEGAPNGGQQQNDDEGQQGLTAAPEFKQLQDSVGQISEMFNNYMQTQQQQQVEQQAAQEWQTALDKNKSLVSNSDGTLNQDAADMVLSLAISKTNGDIDKAFEVYASAVGKQAGLQNQPGRNAPIVGGGAQNAMPSNVVNPANWSDKQRKEAALAVVQAHNRANG